MSENNNFKTALSKAKSLCAKREYCTDDIRIKLDSWGVSHNDSEKILSILQNENFISDLRYSKAYVTDRFRYNKWGKIKIAAHLKNRKIPPSAIKSALDSIDNEEYRKVLKALISDHRKRIKAKNQYDLKGKLLRYGLSKGFESELLYDLLNDF